MTTIDPCFIEFTVHDQAQFAALVRVFEALKREKQHYDAALGQDDTAEAAFPGDDAWLTFFDTNALAHFWWPTEAEFALHMTRWFATPLPERWTEPSLQHPWMFDAMIDAFKQGEYELLACRLVAPIIARLEFNPFAYPYGGTGCMKALIEAFGFHVTGEDDGTGYVENQRV